MDIFTILWSYLFAAFLLLMATVFFGWSRSIRGMLIFCSAIGILFQYGCHQILDGIGRATSGADHLKSEQDNIALYILGIWAITLLVIPNWKKRDVGIFKQKKYDEEE